MSASRRGKRLAYPALALFVAIVATAGLLLATSLRSQRLDRQRMERELERQGAAIIRTLEAGARMGMMMRWGREDLQSLVDEAARQREIAYLALLDRDGAVLAAAGPWRDEGVPVDAAVRDRILAAGAPLVLSHRHGEKGYFVVAKRFEPPSTHRRMMGWRERFPGETPPELIALLGLRTDLWEQVISEGRRRTLLSLLVILMAGSIILYFGILLQNHLVVRRTLDEMRAYAQNIFEHMADALVTVDTAGRIVAFNPAAARLLGRGGVSLRGRPLADVVPEAARLTAAPGDDVREGEIGIPGDGGERTARVSASPLTGEEGARAGSVLLLRDLTEVRRLEARVRESEKLAAIGEMAATVAHEVRNPLSSLKGFAQLFEKTFPAGSAEAEHARLMVREVDRLNRTVTELLFFSRPLKAGTGPVSLRPLLREAAGLLAPDLEARRQEVVIEEGGELRVAGDGDLLTRAFFNILVNAGEAAGDGGRITVRLESGGDTGRVLVRDTGPGLSEEEAAGAFTPFFTTREKGSGLGLAIVRKVVELHGGSVSILSPPEGGAVVEVNLPLYREEEAP